MNANELADELDKFSELGGDVFFGCCADMLRQQADRIAELEKDLALKIRDRDVFKNFTLAYEEHIKKLEKDLLKYDKLAWDALSKQAMYDPKKHGAEE
jgi:plasmid replication initiation protein